MAKMNPAGRRYLGRFTICMVFYVALLVGVDFWFRSGTPPIGAIRYVIALLPAVPIAGVILAMGQYIQEEEDEYLRLIQARVSLIATGLTLIFCTAWGFLEDFANVPHLALYLVFPVYCIALGLTQGISKLVRK